jgi:hypothetical protein
VLAVLASGGVLFSLLIVFISSITRRALKPVEVLSERLAGFTAERGGSIDCLPPATTDEIEQLIRAFHSMQEITRQHRTEKTTTGNGSSACSGGESEPGEVGVSLEYVA